MSFLFKSKTKEPPRTGLPPATRDIRSSDGPQSQIPTLNGVANQTQLPTQTPPQGSSANGSLNSINETVRPEQRRNDERSVERGGFGSGPPSPDHVKSGSVRSGLNGQEIVCLHDSTDDGTPQMLTHITGPTASSPCGSSATAPFQC